MNNLFSKGNFKPIELEFLSDGLLVLQEVAKTQEKWKKPDTDTFINELRDSTVGHYLGYELVNIEKHGFDCKKQRDINVFLEVKNASFDAKSWGATFNDTTIEKAEAFETENVFLCLAIWKNASDLLFLVYGQNKNIGKFLKNKVNNFKDERQTVRSTQTIGLKQLIMDYNFDLICINKQKYEVQNILRLKYKWFDESISSKILDLSEYRIKNKLG